MKQKKSIILLCLSFLLILSCNTKEGGSIGKVAEKKDGLIVCDRSLLKETLTIPLSFFTEELQMVKLDNADEALVRESGVEMSENYILISGGGQMPHKLFDKKTGKFLTNIGSIGQGPGEYNNIYDQQLDEENDRIYLLPWSTQKILLFDLKGNFVETTPLCFGVPKGNFRVDTKAETVIVSALPFDGTKAVVWQQTLNGELLKSIEPGHLSVQPDFSNEMFVYKTGDLYGFNVFTFGPRIDSAYHYDVNQNKLIPVFTMDFKTDKLPIHSYQETKDFFLGDFSEIKKLSANTMTTQNHLFYIVEKKTLKGAYFTLENDYLGGINIEWPIFMLSGDYYTYNVEPANLREKLEEALSKNDKMTPEMKSKLTEMKNTISDDENNYIFYAKYKQDVSLDKLSKDKINSVEEEQEDTEEERVADKVAAEISQKIRHDEVRKIDQNRPPEKIDIIGNRKNPSGKVRLSGLFNRIEYIVIKQTPDTITGRLVVSPNYLYITDRAKGIGQFNRQGEFLGYICKNFFPHTKQDGMMMINAEQNKMFYGATDTYWNEDKLYYKYEDRSEGKTFMMTFDGSQNAQTSDSENENKLRLGTVVSELSKDTRNSKFIGNIWISAQGGKGYKETDFLSVMSAVGDTICIFKDYDPVRDYTKANMRGADSGDSYLLNGVYSVRQSYNDTIYEFTPPNVLTSKYILDFGDMGIKSSNEGVDTGIGLENKLVGPSLFESGKYLFITYTKDYSCPNTASTGSLKYSRLIYDKNSKSIIALYIDKAPDYKGTGWPEAPPVQEIENDLDGMPFVWPTALTSDNKPYAFLPATNLPSVDKRPENLKNIEKDDYVVMIYH